MNKFKIRDIITTEIKVRSISTLTIKYIYVKLNQINKTENKNLNLVNGLYAITYAEIKGNKQRKKLRNPDGGYAEVGNRNQI